MLGKRLRNNGKPSASIRDTQLSKSPHHKQSHGTSIAINVQTVVLTHHFLNANQPGEIENEVSVNFHDAFLYSSFIRRQRDVKSLLADAK